MTPRQLELWVLRAFPTRRGVAGTGKAGAARYLGIGRDTLAGYIAGLHPIPPAIGDRVRAWTGAPEAPAQTRAAWSTARVEIDDDALRQAVARHGSMSAAARALGCSVSVISRRLAR